MWDDLGEDTAKVMALGARYLAMLWESAWTQGDGAAIPARKLTELNPNEVRDRYIQPTFLPSLTLNKIEEILS